MATMVEIHAAKHALRREMGWHWGGPHTRHWHGLPRGIAGIGFGVKRTDGKAVANNCIRVYVNSKRSRKALSAKQRIPKTIDGYYTDVIEVGRFKPHLGPGGSIGSAQGLTGTLACTVRDSQGEYLLGSWHVLANTEGRDGDPVFMPSKALDANAAQVAELIGTPVFHLNGGENAFDAAVARIVDGVTIDSTLSGRKFGAFQRPSVSAKVCKVGAVTGTTTGVVDGISEDIPILYNNRASDRAVLTGQITIVSSGGRFSAEGDSGALVCTSDLEPLGVLVGGSTGGGAGSGLHSFASPIGPILDFYDVTIT